MNYNLIISENEKNNILRLYGIIRKDNIRPIEKLSECKVTNDGQYVIFDNQAYSCITGEKVPINEAWTLSDILHTGADIASIGMDFVIPGSGAVIDVLNAISYIIEGQFKPNKEKDSLYLMALITFAFVLLPGPLQAISVPLKKAIKNGVGLNSKVVVDGIKIINNSLNNLLNRIPLQVSNALKSPLAKKIIGKWKNKISGFISNFTKRIKELLSSLPFNVGSSIKKLDYTKKLEQYIPPKYLTDKKEVSSLLSNLRKLGDDAETLKSNYINKYGESSYISLIQKYLYGSIDKKTLISKLKNVRSPNFKSKQVIGGGVDHRIFPSSINPNVVFKAELRPGEIEKWYDLFLKNPDVFPRVGKKVKVNDENGKILNAVVIEKLKTEPFITLWDKIEKTLWENQKLLPYNQQISSLEFLLKNKNKHPKFNKIWENLSATIQKKYPELSPKINELSRIVNKLYKITENPDIRKYNMGYDLNGKLKSLDI